MEDTTTLVQINVKIPTLDKDKLDFLILQLNRSKALEKTNITKVIRESIHDTVKEVKLPEQSS
jgi:hypothetical protein